MGFALPGFSKGGQMGIDKSKSSAVSTATDNSNVAASDNSAAYKIDGGSTLNILDAGAIGAAFGFGKDAINLVGDSIARASAVTTNALTTQSSAARESLQAVVDLSQAQQKAGVQSLTETMFKWGVGALAVMAAAYAYAQTRKRAA